MKKIILSLFGLMLTAGLFAQTYPYVPIDSLVFVDSAKLANCNDSNIYWGDTVTTRGIVLVDGNISEVGSGSITGGSRPFISLQHLDTAAKTAITGPWNSVVVMGVEAGTSNPNSDIENVVAGDIIEITGIVNVFNGLIQLQPLNSTAVTTVGFTTNVGPTVVQAGQLQDNMRQNILSTGEQWEGSYVELRNMTVTSVSIFSSGSRVEFTIQDSLGNQVLVADRFLPMVRNGISTVNPNSPDTVGSFVEPAVGARFNHIRGLIFQDENGCAGTSAFAGGYEINPISDTDFDQAPSPPAITNITRSILNPNDTQSVTITADIQDFDGNVSTATLYYSADRSAPAGLFSSATMTVSSGNIYSAVIPAFGLDSLVRYYIEATDDSSLTSTVPTTPPAAPLNTFFYTVRANGTTIMDIQTPAPFALNDGSPLTGDTVTVNGTVTASFQTGDLGFLYIQDSTANQYSGIYVNGGPAAVFTFDRGDVVTVTGVVAESFGFTQLNATNAVSTGNKGTIMPVEIDPSDTTFFGSNRSAIEPYESMLLRYKNPNGRVYVQGTLGFGEYTVGSGKNAPRSARVLAGRQVNGQAQGSLDVSYISDTATYGSGLNVTPIQVDTSFSMNHLDGILYYAFGNYKLTPRNNGDFDNLTVSIEDLNTTSVTTNIYPNPASDRIFIQIDESYEFDQLNVQIFDITSRLVVDTRTAISLTSIPLNSLERGVYVLRITDQDNLIHSAKLIVE